MSTYEWANWIVPALQSDPFVAARTILLDGYETRGRTNNSFMPSGIVCHHTADMANIGHDPATCLASNVRGRPPEVPGPISQLHGTFTPPGVKWNGNNPDPRIVVVALGRANHAGSGEYIWGAPSGNGSSIGIEWCGPPEDKWPDIVVELYERVCACLLRNRGWSTQHVTTHYEYARPIGRKIDVSGKTYFAPNNSRLTPWPADAWRAVIQQRLLGVPDMNLIELAGVRYDTRPKNQGGLGDNGGKPLNPGQTVTVNLASKLPRGTRGVFINSVAVNPGSAGHLVAWDSGSVPNKSFGNFPGGAGAFPGFTYTGLDGYGTFRLMSVAKTHVVIDLVAAFVP